MTVISKTIHISTKGNCDMIDITAEIAREISNSTINNGTATIFIAGSTAGITTIEYENDARNLATGRSSGLRQPPERQRNHTAASRRIRHSTIPL
jgi:thiamine phosphate synthase YjbQ (UPF0047 family)